MHDTAIKNAELFINTYLKDSSNVELADIGAQNVTGSIKDVCTTNITYTGVDFVEGKGVDVILDDPYKLPFPDNHFDVITASSCFEHSEFFWELFLEIMRVLKPSGLVYLNAPSNGRYHCYPVDCWRFYPDSGLALANYGQKKGFDCMLLESYVSRQIRTWNDFLCVIIKDKAHADKYQNRITDGFSQYDNARVMRKEGSDYKCIKLNESEIPEDQRFLGWKINKFATRLFQKVLGK